MQQIHCAYWDLHGCRLFRVPEQDRNVMYMCTAQIDSWLESLPSDMESYIRPGCLVLTIFVTMPSVGWMEVNRKYIISLCYFMFKGCGSLILAVFYKKKLLLQGIQGY